MIRLQRSHMDGLSQIRPVCVDSCTVPSALAFNEGHRLLILRTFSPLAKQVDSRLTASLSLIRLCSRTERLGEQNSPCFIAKKG